MEDRTSQIYLGRNRAKPPNNKQVKNKSLITGIVINLILLVSVRKIIEELVNDEASDYAPILNIMMYLRLLNYLKANPYNYPPTKVEPS